MRPPCLRPYLVLWLLLFETLLPPGAFSLKAIAQEQPGAILHPQRYAIALNRSTCPENLEALIAQMLPDLPGYANRVLRREPLGNQADVKIYVITAGNPEFEPLPTAGAGRSTTGRPSTRQENYPQSRGDSRIAGEQPFAPTLPSLNSESESEPDSSSSDRPRTPNDDPKDDPQQVFITTLERQYRGTQVIEIPRYHWLFLTKTTEGWRLALIFSRMGSNRPNEPLTPPEESSDSFMAEAIRLWLRDLWLKSCSDRQNS